MKFCEKLKLLRTERGMNQTEFAKFLGTSKQVISRYEKGENTPKITTVLEYSKKLDVPLSYFTNDNIETIEPNKKTAIESKKEKIAELLQQADEQTQNEILNYITFVLQNKKNQ